MSASRTMTGGISRRSLLGAVGATALAIPSTALLQGCGGGGSGANEVNFLYMGDASGQKQWNALFEEFRKTNPEITLTAQGLATNSNWADFFNQVTSRMAGGQVPDMIQIATEGMRLFASKGLLEPLDPYIAKDKAVIDEYYADVDPKLVEWNAKYGSPDGKTYYLPGEFNTMCMWCHTELYQQAGVELPADGADWTWDDFLAGAKLIKQKTGAYAYHAAPEYFVGVMPWLLSNGASTFDADWAAPTVNTPEAIEAATYCRQMVVDGLSPQPGGTFDEPTAFAQGKLATLGRGRWGIVDLQGVDAVGK
ncbi:MAG: extracellular solute-binding protein, partial [Propionibacteriales bacterium]|nr:extracellular solute-binding protein [Propionibacteriales bacterium]